MGDRLAMKCTEAVETSISEHYNDQVRQVILLSSKMDPETQKNDIDVYEKFTRDLVEFRDDEIEHLNHAKENTRDLKESIAERVFVGIISGGCRLAVEVGKRV